MQQPGSLGCLLTLLCALLLGIEQEGVGPRAPEHHQLQSQPILPCPGELPQNTSSAHQSARTCIGHLHSSLRKDFKGTIQTYKQFSGYSCFQVPEVKCSTPFPQYFQLLRSVQGVVPKFSGDWCICLATPICLLKNKFVLCDPSENLLGWVQLWIPLKLKFWDGLRNQYALDQAFSSLLNFPFFAGKQFTN